MSHINEDRNTLINYLHNISESLSHNLSNKDKNKIYNILEDTFEWIYINTKLDKVDYIDKKNTVENIISSIINKNI